MIRKKLLIMTTALVTPMMTLDMIPAGNVYAEEASGYTYEVKELPYEASDIRYIGGKYFQIRLDTFDETKETGYAFYENDEGVIYDSKPRINRQVAVIDDSGKEIFPYVSTPLSYTYSDGIFSLISSNIEMVYFVNNGGSFDTPVIGDYATGEKDKILIQPRFFDETGKELFDTSLFRNATAMTNSYAVVTLFSNENVPEGLSEELSYVRGYKLCVIDKYGKISMEHLAGYTGYGDGSSFWSSDRDWNVWAVNTAGNSLDLNNDYNNNVFIVSLLSDGLVKFSSTLLFSDKVSDENIINDMGYGNTKTGYFDVEGNIVIPQSDEYDNSGDFHSGLAWVAKNKNGVDNQDGIEVGFMNKKGELSIPMIYDNVLNFGTIGDDHTMVKKGDEFFIIDKNGNEVFDIGDYTTIGGTDGKIVTIGKDGKDGAVDMNNNVVLPFEYDNITRIENGKCMALKDGKVYSITFKSNQSENVSEGDVDMDGTVDASDASQILEEFAAVVNGGQSTFTDGQNKLADVNGDKTVDSSDASLVLAYYSYVMNGGTEDITTWLKTV